MVPCEILEATSIHSSEAPPQTLPTASKNDKDSDSVDEHGFLQTVSLFKSKYV